MKEAKVKSYTRKTKSGKIIKVKGYNRRIRTERDIRKTRNEMYKRRRESDKRMFRDRIIGDDYFSVDI